MPNLSNNEIYTIIGVIIFFIFFLTFIFKKKKDVNNQPEDIVTEYIDINDPEINDIKVVEKPIEWIDLAVDKIDKLNNIEDLSNLSSKKVFHILDDELLAEKNDTGGSGKILIVDDALVVRKKISLLLEKNDYAFVSQKDGQYAITYLKYLINNELELPDVIITDLEMPNVDGIELISWIKSNSQYII